MRFARCVTIAVLAGPLAAGCTGDVAADSPSVPPRPPTESLSPSASPSGANLLAVVAPQPSPDISRADEVGAAAAATYFLQLYGYMMQSGDVTAWDAMSAEGCGFCRRTRDFATSVAKAGGRFSGADINVEGTFVHPLDPRAQAYPVDVQFTQAAGEHTNAQGGTITSSPPDSGVFGVDVTHMTDGWKVLAVTAQDTQ